MAPEECQPPKRPPDEYRQWLVSAEQKAQDDFDKTVISLSGGALGISFVFVKDIIGPGAIHHPMWLLITWMLWALSSLAILSSFFVSHLALRAAIRQCDDGSIYDQTPGGIFSRVTRNLNAAGAIMFVAGVCFMAAFIYSNLSARDVENVGQKTQQSTQQSTQQAARSTAAPAPSPAIKRSR